MLQFLMEYHHEGLTFLNQIITGKGTWVYHHILESKKASMAWCESVEKSLKKVKVGKSAGKLIAIIF